MAVVDGIRYSVNGAVPEDKGEPYTAWVHSSQWNDYEGNVTIPETFTIGDETFVVVGVDDGAFEKSDIRSVTIPKTVKSIDSYAFANCKNLEEIYSAITEVNDTRVSATAFEGSVAQAVLYVPIGTKELYEAADGWKLFKNIVEMDHEDSEGIVTVEKLFAAEKYYDLHGRTVLRPNRGIYVKEGKIVVVK